MAITKKAFFFSMCRECFGGVFVIKCTCGVPVLGGGETISLFPILFFACPTFLECF